MSRSASQQAPAARRATLRRVLRYLRHYLPLLILSLLLAAVTVALTLYVPILTGEAVDRIVGPGGVDFAGVARIALTIGVCVGVTSLAQWIMSVCNNRVTFCVVRDIRRDAFRRLNELPLSYIDSHAHGELVSRIIADVEQFADGLLMGFTQLFTGVLTIVGTLGFMVAIRPSIALVVVLITPVSLFVAAFVAKRTYDMFRIQSEERGAQTGLIDEMVTGARVVQAFGREQAVQARFDAINDRLERASRRAIFFSSITNPATRFVNSLVYAGVCLSGALLAVTGGFSVGNLVSFLSYANQYTKPFNEISGVVTELQNAIACAERILSLIEDTPRVQDAPDAEALTDPDGRVTLSDVSFSYRKDRPLIEGLNLDVKRAQRVAIVGPTGCGKTTVINLLMRFYDVDGGSIRVSGRDIRSLTRRSLRDAYGMVLQETWLKRGTVRENIAFGKPDATEEEIIFAARAAHADGFIRRLPQGYDTVIAEDGGNLSQGQKQLLCISRVMLRLPPMLILDEATSSIDTRTERKIQDAFARLMQGRTSFIVAHRLSTIRSADVILVMRDGRIVESGTHAELLEQNGFYAELYNSQFAK